MPNDDTLSGVLIGFILAIFTNMFVAFLNQQEAKRKERHQYLIDTIRELAEARSEIQWVQIVLYPEKNKITELLKEPFPKEQKWDVFERLQMALGKSHALLVAVDNTYLFQLGTDIMNTDNIDLQIEYLKSALAYLGKMAGITESSAHSDRK